MGLWGSAVGYRAANWELQLSRGVCEALMWDVGLQISNWGWIEGSVGL